jgi:hypothetical protein
MDSPAQAVVDPRALLQVAGPALGLWRPGRGRPPGAELGTASESRRRRGS